MGQLKPGATYVYERQGGVVYAREHGAPADTREAIGWDWQPEDNPARVRGAHKEQLMQNQLWYEIRQEAKNNPALQRALEQCIILYNLSKDHGA